MEPATSIIAKLGGPVMVSKITGTALHTVYKWTYPRERSGRDGFIPRRHHRALLEYAQRNKIPLNSAEFLPEIDLHPNKKRRLAL